MSTTPALFCSNLAISLCKINDFDIRTTCQKISASTAVGTLSSSTVGKSAQRAESESLPQCEGVDRVTRAPARSGEPEQIKADPPRPRHARLGDGPRSGRAEHRGRARRDPFGQNASIGSPPLATEL